MKKKHNSPRLLFAPLLPISGAVAAHYSPAWIQPDIWLYSSLLGMLAYVLSFFEI